LKFSKMKTTCDVLEILLKDKDERILELEAQIAQQNFRFDSLKSLPKVGSFVSPRN